MSIADHQTSTDTVELNEDSFRDVLDILFRRRRIILAVLLLSIAAGVALMLRSRKYTAQGAIRVQPGAASMYRTSPLSALTEDPDDKIESETAILQSRTLYLEVAKQLNLVNDPAFWGKSSLKPQSLDDPKVRENLIRQMRRAIRVAHNPKDEIIDISCTTISPALSAKVVDTLINDYITHLFQMRYGSTKRVSEWLIGQLDDLRQQIERDQTEIIELQKKLGVIGLNEQTAEYLQTQSLNSMTKAASEATIERILAEAKLRYLEDSDPNLMEGEINPLNQGSSISAQNSLLQNLRNAQAQAASNYARLLAQFGPNYPDVKQQKAQLEEINNEVKTEQQRILNQAKLSYNTASANEKMDTDVLGQKTNEAFKSGGDMVRYVLLLHDYQSHRSLYEELVQRLREAGITSGLEAGEIDIVDLADLPVIPNPPGPLLLLTGTLFLGLIGGSFLALTIDSLDSRVKTAEQAQRVARLPLLAILPHAERRKQKGEVPTALLPMFVAPGSHYAEAIQTLRTSILLAIPGLPAKVLLVTSATSGEGKSTTARSLAIVSARHRARTLLIDCDLRKGTQAVAFGINNVKGVSSVLTQQTSLDNAVEKVSGFDNLFVLAAGPHPPDPAVLIGSKQMSDLIDECRDRFDFIVIDSAPILGLSDTINLGQLADVTILVIREGLSNRKAIRDAVTRMNRTKCPLVGFALNDVDFHAHAYHYRYGKNEGYYREPTEDRQ